MSKPDRTIPGGLVWAAMAFVLLVTAATFWNVGSFDFIMFDDPQYVHDNPQVSRGISWPGLVWAFTQSHASNWHPLTWISHMLDVEVFGMNPGAHHWVNLAFHMLNSVLLFGVLLTMTCAVGRSALVAALFAVHPLHVESVAWISERKDVLSALFFMLTLWAYSSYSKQKSGRAYLLVIFFLALGLMSKPMLVTLPFVLLLLDFWPLQRIRIDHWRSRQWLALLIEKIPLFILVALSSVITYIVQRESGAVVELEAASAGLRLSNAVVSYGAYVAAMWWPADLAILYSFPASVAAWKVVTAALFLALITTLAGLGMRRYPFVPVGWFWFLGTLVPVIGLVRVGAQSMADRYTYIPLIGLFIIVAWGGYELLGRRAARRAPLWALSVLIIVLLAFASRTQIEHWKNAETLWIRSLAVTQNNYRVHGMYGKLLTERGQKADAVEQFRAAIRIKPNIAQIHTLLAQALADLGQPAQAIVHYQQSLALRPDLAYTYTGYGNALAAEGKLDEALAQHQKSMELKADNPLAHNGMGLVLDEMGRSDEAIGHYRRAIELDPGFAAAHNNLAAAYAAAGNLEQAVSAIEIALKIQKDNTDYMYNLAVLLSQQGDLPSARQILRSALEIDPQFDAARQALQILAGAGVGEEEAQ